MEFLAFSYIVFGFHFNFHFHTPHVKQMSTSTVIIILIITKSLLSSTILHAWCDHLSLRQTQNVVNSYLWEGENWKNKFTSQWILDLTINMRQDAFLEFKICHIWRNCGKCGEWSQCPSQVSRWHITFPFIHLPEIRDTIEEGTCMLVKYDLKVTLFRPALAGILWIN